MEFGIYLLNVAKNAHAQERARAKRKGSYPTKKLKVFLTTPIYDLHVVERFCDKQTCNYKMPPPNVPVVLFLVKQADSRYTNSMDTKNFIQNSHKLKESGIGSFPFFKHICIKLFGSTKGCSSFFLLRGKSKNDSLSNDLQVVVLCQLLENHRQKKVVALHRSFLFGCFFVE